MRGVERSLLRRSNVASSERTRSDNVKMQAFVDLQRKSKEEMSNTEQAESEEDLERAERRRSSAGTLEGMRVIKIVNGKRDEKIAESLDGGAGMEFTKGERSYLLRMGLKEKLISVKEKLRKMKDNHYSLVVSVQLT